MAIKGLSIPVCGTYKKEEDRVSYEEPFVADHAVEYGVSWEMGDDAPLYGDNKTIENARGTFKSGELTLGTADLPQELSMKILGLKVKETEFGPEGEKIQVKELTYDDDMKAPYLGFGIIEEHQIDDVDQYRAVFLPKVCFNLPEEAATTRGESVEWQTKSATAKILRSDAVDEENKHPWMQDAWFTKESEAVEYLMWKCGKKWEGGL